jgi:hypothetical protein
MGVSPITRRNCRAKLDVPEATRLWWSFERTAAPTEQRLAQVEQRAAQRDAAARGVAARRTMDPRVMV